MATRAEVEITVDPSRLEQAQLDMSRLATAVADALKLEPVGRLDVHYQQELVVVRGPVENLDMLSQIVVGGTPAHQSCWEMSRTWRRDTRIACPSPR